MINARAEMHSLHIFPPRKKTGMTKAYSFTGVEHGEPNATASSKDIDQEPFAKDWYAKRLREGTWCTELKPWMMEQYPTKVRINSSDFRLLTPWVIYASHWGVSQQVKLIIERFEPGKHQFIPVTVYFNGDVVTYYTLQINNMSNEIDEDKSHITWSELPGLGRFWRKESHLPLAFPIESIRGIHLWRNEKARIWMMSGELHDALQSESLLSGLKLQEQVVV
jgi:hypothetical protein